MDAAPVDAASATPFHLMAKPTGAACNLDCDYCFFLSREQLYPGSRFRMEDQVREAWLRQLFAAHGDRDEVVVTFQGGEPTLMGLDWFVDTLALAEELRRPGQRPVYTLQTNGTLLDDDWGAFLSAHDVLVGLSIDGPAELHDAHRVDRGGRPTFDRVVRGLEVLQRHGVAWNALATVNATNGDHGAGVYTFLRDELGARFVQFIPVVERLATAPVAPDIDLPMAFATAARVEAQADPGALVPAWSVGPDQFGRFLVDVFEEWVRHDVGEVFVSHFDTALAHWLGLDQVGMCVHARTCGSALVVEHTGDVYACDHYVDDDHRLGNLVGDRPLLDLVTGPAQQEFGRAKADDLPATCRTCDVRFACNGGCPKDRFLATADGEPGLNWLCAGYQRFFRHVDAPMQVLARLVSRGDDPARVMDWVRDRDVARAPHDPCSCGRDLAWADCHGATHPIEVPTLSLNTERSHHVHRLR